VFEWCADWFSPEYYAESPAVDPSGPPKGENRVQRSGYRYPGLIRSAVRVPTVPSVRENILGFRVACSVPTGSE
jgi:formylglycine-generating enzyme required for sulfatase activity